MVTAALKAKIVRVTFEWDDVGLFYATSPDLKGLVACASTIEQLREKIPQIIVDMYAACDVDIVVREIENDGDNSWVAVPLTAQGSSIAHVG